MSCPRVDPTCAMRVDHLMAGHSALPCIVWFRDDLRLCDHPALHAASKTGAPVICLYVFDEASDALCGRGARPLGGAARWWLAQSLKALQMSLNAVGASLVLRKGPAAPIIAGHARPGPAKCSGTRLHRRRIKPWLVGSRRRLRRSASPRKVLPAICWRPRATFATRRAADCGYSSRSGGGFRILGTLRSHCRRRRRSVLYPTLQAIRLRNGIWNPRIPTGPEVCAKHGSRARSRRWPGSMHFSKAA